MENSGSKTPDETPRRHHNKTWIECIYLKIYGNNQLKSKYLEKITKPETITIVAEHWFSSFQDLSTLNSFIKSSENNLPKPAVGRSHGGLAILAGSSIRHLVTIINITPYFIKFRIGTKVLAAVYLPPSLNIKSVDEVLVELGQVDMLVGDFNVRYGALTNDTTTTNPQRRLVIENFITYHNLSHCIPARCSRNDHLFSSDTHHVEYIPTPRNECPSDHDMLVWKFAIKALENVHSCSKKHSLRNVSHPRIQLQIMLAFESISLPLLQELLAKSQILVLLNNLSRDAIHELVDRIYQHFAEEIGWIIDAHLEKYCPKCQIRFPMDVPQFSSNLKAIKFFKRNFRTNNTQTVFGTKTNKTVAEAAIQHYKAIYMGPQDEIQLPFLPMDLHLEPFIPQDIKDCLKGYPAGKSGGPDEIPIAIYKILSASQKSIEFIANLFSFFQKCGCTPTNWNTSRIILLPKSEKNIVEESRPISLTNIIRRVYEKLLLKKWIRSEWAKTSPFQAGFKFGFSTYSNILLLDEEMHKNNTITIFLDLKQAYDKVPFQKLIDILIQRGCPVKDVHLIYSLMMRKIKSSIVVNQHEANEKITRNQGVLQGSILSPFLFNMFIDDLAIRLNQGFDTPALFFADDIALSCNQNNAQEKLDICYSWSKNNGMEFQISKCGVINTLGPELRIGPTVLPSVSSYKYLGLPFEKSGCNWLKYAKETSDKFQRLTKGLFSARRAWDMATRTIILKTFLYSVVNYALPLVINWKERQLAPIKSKIDRHLKDNQDMALEFIFDKKPGKGVSRNLCSSFAILFPCLSSKKYGKRL